jgi:16S rRNA (guanine527-N7)-methyltransferase
MTDQTFLDALSTGATRLGIELNSKQLAQLIAYWDLLDRWNQTINLTSIPLQGHPQASVDRLLLEPIAAHRLMPAASAVWYDLGSGNGSPAVPLSIVSPGLRLTMVESRTRKVAFLREAVRSLEMATTAVMAVRFEEMAAGRRQVADCVTVRAVRPDAGLLAACASLLKPDARLILFGATNQIDELPGFTLVENLASPSAGSSIHAFVPRGTFKR